MALTRKLLKSFGLEESVIDSIIEAHAETVEGLKSQITGLTQTAESTQAVTRERDELRNQLEALQKSSGDAAKVQKELDDLKNSIAAEKTAAAARSHARELLKNDVGIKRESALDLILAAENLDGYEKDADGRLKDPAAFTLAMKTKHAEWIGEASTTGTPPATPPTGDAKGTMTKEQIMAIRDPAERRAAIASNLTIFDKKE